MKRTLSATAGLAALVVSLTACTIGSRSMELGTEFYRNNEYLSAADAFTEAIAINPNSPGGWNNRAAARVRLGDLNGAIADYNRALELAPKDPEIYYNRGNALVAAGLYQDAIADFTRALTLDANFSKAAFNRGTAYAMLGQREAAKQDWAQAISLEPDPWTKSAMRRSAGLDGAPAVVSVVTREAIPSNVISAPAPGTGPATVPLPGTPSAVPANPPVPPAGPPQVVVAPSTSPSASPQALDARALAARAITRELDGDHAGAMQDLRAALALEPDPTRQVAITRLMRLLEASR
jgi:tetratricopeptide (TPR) repeat protein